MILYHSLVLNTELIIDMLILATRRLNSIPEKTVLKDYKIKHVSHGPINIVSDHNRALNETPQF